MKNLIVEVVCVSVYVVVVWWKICLFEAVVLVCRCVVVGCGEVESDDCHCDRGYWFFCGCGDDVLYCVVILGVSVQS